MEPDDIAGQFVGRLNSCAGYVYIGDAGEDLKSGDMLACFGEDGTFIKYEDGGIYFLGRFPRAVMHCDARKGDKLFQAPGQAKTVTKAVLSANPNP